MRLGSGTLYEAIQRLESSGWVIEAPAPPGEGASRRSRFYALTESGRHALELEVGRLERIVRFARDSRLLPES